ncbi:uncharacterized protein LOC114157033 [Xiphophorus couchianus]|uniref:uncharacterized protein LOC114157033 n=1 Tax=Xiphophorus couchianus TaxID=32473 RepID=UPI0010169101|nr:uncharacterized protein LOC114157033 [Xiphophorus couchianus]
MTWTIEEGFCLWKWTKVLAFIVLSLHPCVSEDGIKMIQKIEVNVTQKLYQVEKNHNITLDLTFTTKPECSQTFWLVLCYRMEDKKVLYQYVDVGSNKVSESQDEQFSGRVLFDQDLLRKGRIRLHVYSLKMEDSGFYVCKLTIGHCMGLDTCNLIVTDPHPSELPATISSPPENWGRTGLIIVVAAIVVTILIIGYFTSRKKNDSESQPLRLR